MQTYIYYSYYVLSSYVACVVPRTPSGEARDPTNIYIAVGKAIHAWERMEESIGYLYLKFQGQSPTPDHLKQYGLAGRTFDSRIALLVAAADHYFIKSCDQHKEGEFDSIVKTVKNLALERHRIAHGHISMFGRIPIPEERGLHTITMAVNIGGVLPSTQLAD